MRIIKQNGISVIEVVIVLSIIGILVAITIPHLIMGRRTLSHKVYIVHRPDGTTVRCKNSYDANCGSYCTECEDGAEYHCVHDVQEVQEAQ